MNNDALIISYNIQNSPTCNIATIQKPIAPFTAGIPACVVDGENAKLSKKSRLGYAMNQWDALCYYCDDGLAKRALRAVSLGKKNYIFFGSDHGGERGTLL